MNSRSKGCRGEREFRDVLRAAGFEARRGQQYSGGGDSPDVISNVPGVHWEVKRVEAGNPYVWLAQAIRDAGNGASDDGDRSGPSDTGSNPTVGIGFRKELGVGFGQHQLGCSRGRVMPIVAHKRNGQEWVAVLLMDDLIRLLKAGLPCEGKVPHE